MTIEIKQIDLRQAAIRTRMPFRYGIATLTEAPYLLVFADFVVDGTTIRGIAADILPPKWFTKDPNAAIDAELADLVSVIRRAAALSLNVGQQPNAYRWWRELLHRQMADAALQRHPPLLKAFGASLLERSAIDATCRRHDVRFHQALRSGLFGICLDEHHAELAGGTPAQFLPGKPLDSVSVRHTVGLVDPLTPAEITVAERIDDGLPQALEQCIAQYGLTHFKIKLPADIAVAKERLCAIAAVIEQANIVYQFTLDGNEFFNDPEEFRDFWSELSSDATIRPFLRRGLLLVEQPLHRDIALSDQVHGVFADWRYRPTLIIDESDGEIRSLSQALDAGYDGTSHKNCKGVFKGIANACLVAHRNRAENGRSLIMTGEDLMNIGPVALLQDLAVGAALGLSHMERNGHHYVAGLLAFPDLVQRAMLDSHADLYTRGEETSKESWPRLAIRKGQVALGSVNNAPFGYDIEINPSAFDSLAGT